MPYNMPLSCPACTEQMTVTELTCPNCATKVQGDFRVPGLHRLNSEQLQFVEVFLRCRGNIREVERDLKISYPTVRSRLDQVIVAMGYADQSRTESDGAVHVEQALDALGSGELSFEDALKILREGKTV